MKYKSANSMENVLDVVSVDCLCLGQVPLLRVSEGVMGTVSPLSPTDGRSFHFCGTGYKRVMRKVRSAALRGRRY